MGDDVLGKTLVLAVDMGKADRATLNFAFIHSILHKELGHQLSAGITGALAVLCC